MNKGKQSKNQIREVLSILKLVIPMADFGLSAGGIVAYLNINSKLEKSVLVEIDFDDGLEYGALVAALAAREQLGLNAFRAEFKVNTLNKPVCFISVGEKTKRIKWALWQAFCEVEREGLLKNTYSSTTAYVTDTKYCCMICLSQIA